MMTIEATKTIYNFRSISRVQESRPAARRPPQIADNDQQQLDLFTSQIVLGAVSQTNEPVESEPETTPTVANLFERFFADKVRRYDIDMDGSLNRDEFKGDDNEWELLDTDGDGLIGAADLQRRFMEENPEMREMAEGFAGGLYDQILDTAITDPEELAGMVNDFFLELVENHDTSDRGVLADRDFPGTKDEFRRIAGKDRGTITVDNLIDDFKKNNPDLTELRESLQQFRMMVAPPAVRPQQVDVYG